MAKAASLGILSLSELPADDACPLFAGAKQRTAVPRADILEAEAQLDLDALAEIRRRRGPQDRARRIPRPLATRVASGVGYGYGGC